LKSITLSPIRRVPTDVLCEIFVHCLPKIERPAYNSRIAKEAPLLLCQVCSKWRRTAIKFPTLWKALVLQRVYTFNDDTESSLVDPSLSTVLNSWFARAGTCSLSLDLYVYYTIRSGLTLELEEVFNQLQNLRLQHLSSFFTPVMRIFSHIYHGDSRNWSQFFWMPNLPVFIMILHPRVIFSNQHLAFVLQSSVISSTTPSQKT